MSAFFQRHRVLLLHLSFWCVYLSFFLYQISRWADRWERALIAVAITLTFTPLIAYINYFYLLPRFLTRKDLKRYLLEFTLMFAVLITIRLNFETYLVDTLVAREEFLHSARFFIQVVAITLFIVIFVGMLRFALEWFELENRKKEIENEKLIAELNFLKAQINPHFLFNTLNNLYYLAYTQSPNTTEVIAKLSQMMRYMIYDSNHPRVLLSKEIEYMENYISLERLRLNDQVPIRFEVKGNPQSVTIVPLVLITFLENAFKHGVSNNQTGAWVNILIDVQGKNCIYVVENSKTFNKNPGVEKKSGIGLLNVQRRLELSYPGNYELKVEDLPDRYSVQLNLTLLEPDLSDRRRRTVSA